MSEKNENCIRDDEKFDSLKNLIEKYACLVKNYPDGLPPYAGFKIYLVDDVNTKPICIDRPTKIKSLVDAINQDDEDKKLDAILKLWATGGDIYIDGKEDPTKSDKLIHSISNKSRLQVCLKNASDKKDTKDKSLGKILDKETLLQFANVVGSYIKFFKKEDLLQDIKVKHELLKNDEFKILLNNEIDAAINELLFWYYYEDDTYPIINSRAKNSRKILNKAFSLKVTDDLKFNEECLKHLKPLKEVDSVQIKNTKISEISKQLMLDQLFYSIDEMKNMKKVEETYPEKNNEIYKFYQKLWNTIKGAKSNDKIQSYYTDFLENFNTYEKWYDNAKNLCENLNNIKDAKIENIDNFVKKYFEEPSNGIASIKGGQISSTKADDFKKILENDKSMLFCNYQDISKLENFLEQHIIAKNGNNIKQAVINRYLLTLYPENFTAVASGGKFDELIKSLKSKLDIKLESEGYIEQNNELMGFYLKKEDGTEEDDIYKKKIFYWWLHEMLSDNLDLKKAIVYYGAPGTGKTYKAKKVAKQFMETWNIKNGGFIKDIKESIVIQQFHPSFAYEDFIEGIRPTNNNTLELQNGVFKNFCKTAGSVEIELWQNEVFRKKFKGLNDFSAIKVKDVKELNNKDINKLLKITDLDGKEEKDTLTLLDIIPPAFFIIDEINRADLSRVFGELMYSLEYRGYEGKLKTQYSYLVKDEKDEATFFYEDKENYFFIPQNIYIIGTMNTIDRSVDSFDFALRRRFSWEEIGPDYDVIKNELNPKIADEIATSFKNLNEHILGNALLGSDYQVGHAYALNLKNQKFTTVKNAKEFLWGNFIKPLLQEYFRGFGDSEEEIKKLKKAFDTNE